LDLSSQRLGELVTSIGAVVAAVATNRDAATASAAAQQVDAYNRQLHPVETGRVQQLAQGDVEREARLGAAACALVRCADGVPTDDPSYAYLRALQDEGAGYTAEQALLRQQQGQIGRSRQTLFGYDPLVDTSLDWLSQNRVGTRAAGTAQAVGGAALIASGAVECTTGIGCTLGAASMVFGADQLQAGARTAASGQTAATQGELVLQSLGMSPEAAAVSYAALGVAPAAAGAVVANRAANATAELNALTRASYANDFATHGLQATPEVMATPQAQALMREIAAGSPGLSPQRVIDYARDYIQSGTSLPVQSFATADTIAIKVVPRGEGVTDFSGFWMTPQQARVIATMSPTQAAQVLGLPAPQAARMQLQGMDFVAISPRTGVTPTVFTSEIARITQGGIAMPGGAQQLLVPNRSQWTPATPIDPATLRQ
ncbi:MAG TPA: hypothetical protein VFR90_03845, partial [Methylibium sp.]|uniref:hypothetical protein n=1 Tax=Methylibium sp. TaxID=2067992 RepID=UPI002DB6BC60